MGRQGLPRALGRQVRRRAARGPPAAPGDAPEDALFDGPAMDESAEAAAERWPEPGDPAYEEPVARYRQELAEAERATAESSGQGGGGGAQPAGLGAAHPGYAAAAGGMGVDSMVGSRGGPPGAANGSAAGVQEGAPPANVTARVAGAPGAEEELSSAAGGAAPAAAGEGIVASDAPEAAAEGEEDGAGEPGEPALVLDQQEADALEEGREAEAEAEPASAEDDDLLEADPAHPHAEADLIQEGAAEPTLGGAALGATGLSTVTSTVEGNSSAGGQAGDYAMESEEPLSVDDSSAAPDSREETAPGRMELDASAHVLAPNITALDEDEMGEEGTSATGEDASDAAGSLQDEEAVVIEDEPAQEAGLPDLVTEAAAAPVVGHDTGLPKKPVSAMDEFEEAAEDSGAAEGSPDNVPAKDFDVDADKSGKFEALQELVDEDELPPAEQHPSKSLHDTAALGGGLPEVEAVGNGVGKGMEAGNMTDAHGLSDEL